MGRALRVNSVHLKDMLGAIQTCASFLHGMALLI
ncbi:hypothetical protein BQ8482_320013 [Mesorhizobium delmotii]|uniref:Uncharacterized protein n=1 Tax=Mesorhizobium delmotii TaxID=1631247 RepID=A0A2P9ANX4_9HYPH|nr:hypothetical protein BQ8482_320013 [Mesorhizobium delmotii]